MQLAAAGNLEAFRSVGFLHMQGNVRVQFAEQPVPYVAAGNEFPFLAGEGRVIYLSLIHI